MDLVDTSTWIEIFRKPPRIHLEDVSDLEEVVTCLPVIQEILQGFSDEHAYLLARESMLSFPLVESPLPWVVFEEAARLYRAARRAGNTVRSGADCLIAACALRHDLTIVHFDRDFEKLKRVSALKTRRVRRR